MLVLFAYSTPRQQLGVILYGVPGTGKTLLAKAVANQTSATFLRIVGSELIQKYLGDGPKLVRELFRVAEELAPSIVFIDEIDAIGTKRLVFFPSFFFRVGFLSNFCIRSQATVAFSSAMILIRLLIPIDTIQIQEENEKFKELC